MTLSQRLVIAMAGVAIATVVIVRFAVGHRIQAELAPFELEWQTQSTMRLAAELNMRARGVGEDVLVALHSVPIQTLLDDAAPASESDAAHAQTTMAFTAQLLAKPHYLQLRVIGVNRGGREVVRVERTERAGPIREVPDTELQPKGERDYFRAAVALSDGDVYVSPIQLNEEHGEVEHPYIPVLRAATPVIGADGRALGIVVINVDMRGALDPLRAAPSEGGGSYLVDENGDFIVHPDRDREFATQLGHTNRFPDEFPMLRHVAEASTSGASKTITQDEELIVTAVPVALNDGPRLFVISMVPSAHGQITASAQRTTLAVAVLTALVAAAAAFLAARSVTRPLTQMIVAAETLPNDGDAEFPTRGGGEIGILARTLERMNATVRAHNEALQREERKFRLVVESAPNAILLMDSTNREIALVNQRAEALFGYERSELIGQPLEKLIPERFHEAHSGYVGAFLRDAKARPMGAGRELFAQRKDGTEVPVEIGINPLETPDGMFVLASIIDVTERKRYEDELRRSNAELEQFAYVASHDLQEPLRMVANYTELLERRYKDRLDEKATKYIFYASDGARRMQRLVTDLLAYSRVGSQGKRLEPVASAEAVDGVQRTLRHLMNQAGASIEPGELPVVLADETQLRQLFQNLIGNAIKFRSADPPRIVIEAVAMGSEWQFSVADNGIGIDMQYAERIFQMFQRLHELGKFDGSGIGLAIAKRIVERHNGKIWVESRLGAGTTFFFTLQDAARGDR